MSADELHEIAMHIAGAAMYMEDGDVVQLFHLHGIGGVWHLALDIAAYGPQNDMERRIVAEALVRRLKGSNGQGHEDRGQGRGKAWLAP